MEDMSRGLPANQPPPVPPPYHIFTKDLYYYKDKYCVYNKGIGVKERNVIEGEEVGERKNTRTCDEGGDFWKLRATQLRKQAKVPGLCIPAVYTPWDM